MAKAPKRTTKKSAGALAGAAAVQGDAAVASDVRRKKPAVEKIAAKKAAVKKLGSGKRAAGKAAGKKPAAKRIAAKKIGIGKAGTKKASTTKTVRRAMKSGSAVLRTATLDGATAGVLDRLFEVVTLRRDADPNISHSARLLSRGTAKVAQKFGEEAVECLIEAVAGNSAKLVGESADVLYHLIVMWVDAGLHPGEIWAELQRREGTSGIAEKLSRGASATMAGE